MTLWTNRLRTENETWTISQELIDAITDMRENEALKIANQLLDEGTDPMQVLNACSTAMEVIGKRFEEGDCFIPELSLDGAVEGIPPETKPENAEVIIKAALEYGVY
jgi:methanogenic corrinoid protein MtbC1